MMLEPSGIIFDVDHFAVHDGPGIRTVVYFKGCPLRCVWCHSPESQRKDPEPLRIKSKCASCPVCAGEGCPAGAYRFCGRRVAVSDLCEELLSDKIFFDSSGGGVTLSGGEALSQPEFAKALLGKLKSEGIHTVVETSVMGAADFLREISPFTDIFYCDVKLMDSERHREYTGAGNETILANIKMLAGLRERSGIVLRVPLIPGFTDGENGVAEIFRFAVEAGLPEAHLLPYNSSAPAKYDWVAREYQPGNLERQSNEYLNRLVTLAPSGLKVKVQ